jgi:hypothetical protein
MRRTLLVCAGIALTWVGCHRPPPVPDAGPVQVDAGPPPPPPLALSLRVTDEDGGTEVFPLQPGEPPSIAPTQALELLTNKPLKNQRLRILDEAERVMASDETLEQTDAGTRDQVHFLQPLLGGHRYTVVLDAQTPGDVVDPEGKPVPEQRLTFQTTGEREQPPKPAPKKRSRHHRRH